MCVPVVVIRLNSSYSQAAWLAGDSVSAICTGAMVTTGEGTLLIFDSKQLLEFS